MLQNSNLLDQYQFAEKEQEDPARLCAGSGNNNVLTQIWEF